jgi:hypothetical protein
VVCRKDYVTNRLVTFADYFEARVVDFTKEREDHASGIRRETRAFVERVLHQRLHQPGRRPLILLRRIIGTGKVPREKQELEARIQKFKQTVQKVKHHAT